MKIISLKRTKKEKATDKPQEVKQEDYPYGTRLDLEHEHVKQLIGDGDMPKSGAPVEVHGRGYIHRAETTDEGGEKKHRLSIQMTHVGFSGKKAEEKPDDIKADLKNAMVGKQKAPPPEAAE